MRFEERPIEGASDAPSASQQDAEVFSHTGVLKVSYALSLKSILESLEETRYSAHYNYRRCETTATLKGEISRVFNEAESFVDTFSKTQKNEIYTNLLVELFTESERFREIRVHYLTRCLLLFADCEGYRADIEMAAETSAERCTYFADDWLHQIRDFLPHDYLASAAAMSKRAESIMFKLNDTSEEFSITRELTKPFFDGWEDKLLSSAPLLRTLRKEYCDYLEEFFSCEASAHDPYVVYRDLKTLDYASYFESSEFCEMRDKCLAEKFEKRCFQDLPLYLGFYARSFDNLNEYALREQESFFKIRETAQDAILDVMRNGDVSHLQAIEVALRAIVPFSFASGKAFHDAALEGSMRICDSGDLQALSQLFIKLVPSGRAFRESIPQGTRENVLKLVSAGVARFNKLQCAVKDLLLYKELPSAKLEKKARELHSLWPLMEELGVLTPIFGLDELGKKKIKIKTVKHSSKIEDYLSKKFGSLDVGKGCTRGAISPFSLDSCESKIARLRREEAHTDAFMEVCLLLDALEYNPAHNTELKYLQCEYERQYRDYREEMRLQSENRNHP